VIVITRESAENTRNIGDLGKILALKNTTGIITGSTNVSTATIVKGNFRWFFHAPHNSSSPITRLLA
jgi:hypothetical protein